MADGYRDAVCFVPCVARVASRDSQIFRLRTGSFSEPDPEPEATEKLVGTIKLATVAAGVLSPKAIYLIVFPIREHLGLCPSSLLCSKPQIVMAKLGKSGG